MRTCAGCAIPGRGGRPSRHCARRGGTPPASVRPRWFGAAGDPPRWPIAVARCGPHLWLEQESRCVLSRGARSVRCASARLQAQLRAQLDQVRQSRASIIEAADKGRRRLERDLHDGAQQQLVTLPLSLQLAKAEALEHSDPNTAHMLDGSIESLRQALNELRSLARGIHPTVLVQAGLALAIRTLAARSPIQVDVTRRPGPPGTQTRGGSLLPCGRSSNRRGSAFEGPAPLH